MTEMTSLEPGDASFRPALVQSKAMFSKIAADVMMRDIPLFQRLHVDISVLLRRADLVRGRANYERGRSSKATPSHQSLLAFHQRWRILATVLIPETMVPWMEPV
eukprot:CAMPEP_0197650984 /NCGR_PEP_ID=MMETSP1338-20131121/31281_1 /TAXON_ID=43686 ORGANISM="Pelagodinium beii, Strain RCC1491" /NCGR_SAMPLE_ID=MMETSP1338 /ASSEMBLY_ACC=CAM_ASM_000754 /LENGTH=104 /DNA_ID=CAMNT_0043225513 /DNA_START=267 /DNA_END=581 /DNA_ORIENTATION=+